jgi:hypothetical protein
MKGLQFLLQSFGINIDPAQIELAFQQGKDSLPKIAQAFDELNARMQRMETAQFMLNSNVELLLSRTSGEVRPDPVHEEILNGADPVALKAQIINGFAMPKGGGFRG